MKRIIAFVITLVLCLSVLTGCGGNTQANENAMSQDTEKSETNKQQKTEASSSDIVIENIPAASEGDIKTGTGGTVSEAYNDTVAQVTEIGKDSISYKVCKAKNGDQAIDFSLIKKDDYTVTNETGSIKFDESTPFYLRNDGMWYQSSAARLEVGNTIVIASVEETGELEGIIILD